MNKVADFLDKYDIILFDMDGVITSEDNYWTCAALAVKEIVAGRGLCKLGEADLDYMNENPLAVRSEVLVCDKTISYLKNKGVNSNWDLAYVVASCAIILGTENYNAIYDHLVTLDLDAFGLYSHIEDELIKKGFKKEEATRLGGFWNEVCDCFQQWYLGDRLYFETYNKRPKLKGKRGLIYNEVPLFEPDELKPVLKALYESGKQLGVATGRVSAELFPHFEKWDIARYFDKNRIITYSHVTKAEDDLREGMGNLNLTKPHPYMFLKGALGADYPDKKIVDGDFDKGAFSRVLAVGDAGADMFSAKSAGIDFCAVLTGVAGKSAEGFFKENDATYILESVLSFTEQI